MASFILSTANTGFIPFSSSTPLLPTSPHSEAGSASSYDDGPAENARTDKFPVLEHRLYIINRNGTGEASYLLLTDDARSILSYRVHTETWKPIEGVINFGVVVVGSWIYVVGGFDTTLATTLKRVIRYDPREGHWEECKDMIQPRSRFGVCVVGDKIWVCGGERSDGKITASCEFYDPNLNEWSKGGMLLEPRANPACMSYGSDLLCAGGFYNGTVHNNLWMYDEYRWQELDEHYPHRLPQCLDRCAIAADGNTFYFLGGVTATIPNKEKKKRSKEVRPRVGLNIFAAQNGASVPKLSLDDQIEQFQTKNKLPNIDITNKVNTSHTDTVSKNSKQKQKQSPVKKEENTQKHIAMKIDKSDSTKRKRDDSNGSSINSIKSSQAAGSKARVKENGMTGNDVTRKQKDGRSKHEAGADGVTKDRTELSQELISRPRFSTERKVFSFATSILAGEKSQSMDVISPWNFRFPPMMHSRHSAAAVVIGHKIHVIGGSSIETGQAVKMSEHFNLMTRQWEDDFSLRRFDVSNVCCAVVGLPKVPFQDRKSIVRLKWVMW